DVEAELRKQFESEAEPKPRVGKTEPRKQSAPSAPPPAAEAPAVEPTSSDPPAPEPPPVEAPNSGTTEVPKPPPSEAKPNPPADMGRGGAQHQAIQKRLKEAGEKLGYRVTTEMPILDRAGSVDLVLESPKRKFAVEITVTTTFD